MKYNNENKKDNKYYFIGPCCSVLGVFLILLKGVIGDYIDEFGILYESFFLIPIGYLLILIGILILVICKIKNKKNKK